MNVGRTIFYDIDTGEILVDTFEKTGNASYKEPEYYIPKYWRLSERNKGTFDYIELPYGAYAQDFREGRLIKIDPESQELIFEYPNPENPDEPIIPEKPLSVEIEEVKQENQLLQQSLLELTSYAATQDERLATQEQALLELSTVLAGGDE